MEHFKTSTELVDKIAELETVYKTACETYRERKASKYLEFANPLEGKKPSEATLASMLDVDPELIALRKERMVAEVEYNKIKNELLVWGASNA